MHVHSQSNFLASFSFAGEYIFNIVFIKFGLVQMLFLVIVAKNLFFV